MRQHLKYIIISLLFFEFISCSGPGKNLYVISGGRNTYDSGVVVKKADKIKKLYIANYTDSIFPNEILKKLTKIEKLVIYSDNWDKNVHQNCPDMNFDQIEIDQLYFDTANLYLLKNLKSLTLFGFTLDSFPYQLHLLDSLEELNLIASSLNKFPINLSMFNRLKKLNLSINDILSIPDTVTFPNSLKVLRLSNNKLT
jgi:Leucine-rich repeat (LRR) protein